MFHNCPQDEYLKPKFFSVIKKTGKDQIIKDIVAGIIVAIIALPLSIALALASGVEPQCGIYTAIAAGFFVSLFGGSRIQIAGPTAAFATIVAGIVATQGMDGLFLATIIAGILLILMGVFKLGSLIKFIPYTITTGFTSGIALTILIGQLKDFFGVTYMNGEKPIETIEKLEANLYHPEIPALDMVIRTSGEERISGFMLWRMAYAEMLFLDKKWPDMTKEDVPKILEEFVGRQRRFGK